ncbi:MAG: hypothetical protein ABI346_01060, partial [Candidatus Baltobacteraceae bacterium]
MMVYPEYLRVRRVLRTVLIVVVVGTLLALIVLALTRGHWGSVSFNDGASVRIDSHAAGAHRVSLYEALASKGVRIPIAALIGIAGLFSAIVATVLGTSLNRENETLATIWTKPAARFRIALAYAGVDAVGILAAGAISVVIGVLSILAFLGVLPLLTFGNGTLQTLLLVTGFAFATYGTISALTSWTRRSGGIVAGLFWPIGLLIYGMMAVSVPEGVHATVVAINFLNPLAYLGTVSDKGVQSLLPVALNARIG